MSSKKGSEYFSMLNAGERFIVVASIFMAVVTLASFICSLTAYLITHKTQNIIDSAIDAYNNGTLYSNNDCFECTNTGCGNSVPPTTPCMLIKEELLMEDYGKQQFGQTTPTTIGVIQFPQSEKTGAAIGTEDWFNEHIRLQPGSDMVITESFKSNTINAIQIGTFDYINNQTTVCNHLKALNGAVYYAVDPADTTLRYLCICVAIPPLFTTFGESCSQFI
jgi:hypothetical protein